MVIQQGQPYSLRMYFVHLRSCASGTYGHVIGRNARRQDLAPKDERIWPEDRFLSGRLIFQAERLIKRHMIWKQDQWLPSTEPAKFESGAEKNLLDVAGGSGCSDGRNRAGTAEFHVG